MLPPNYEGSIFTLTRRQCGDQRRGQDDGDALSEMAVAREEIWVSKQ